ncbi:Deleted in malignant brain tumors 1 protein [Nibea albiflora]|uniref:Deleted in malignant brain tumors 1 protein n=1 Tax=Nibea albiflora TaxID=240163 RepID=A0ACB7F0E5_NIBAL|nr:Deleted in malignant brain tumors 1 protein [Nibea albiflora]
MNDARVVCQQLGCGRSVSIPKKAHFGQGSGPISEYQLQCSGQESSITDCKKKELGSDKCRHEDDAGVICEEIGTTVTTPATTVTTPATTVTTPATTVTTPATTPTPTTPSTLVRLVNSDNPCSGRVEIFLNGQWQTVCDKGWGMNDARVVCQQLGCGRSVSIPKKAHFGQGSGPISEYQLQCSGQESSITDCKKKELGSDKCGHEDDAGVICEEIGTTVTTPATTVTTPATTVTTPATTVTTPATTPSPTTPSTLVRLVNSDNPCSGRVEIFLNGQWQTVCDKGWGMNDARVVCQQLGCGRSVSIPKKAHFGQGSGPISEYQLQCSGQESSITDCKKKELGSDKCGHEDDAGVICEEIGTTVTTPATTVTTPATTVTTPATTVTTPATTPSPTTPSTLVRLVNSDNPCSGRVEIFLNGQWQTVCDKGWGMNDARVVCQQLGCGRSVSIPKKAHFGQGSGPISEYQLQCSGQESSITDCKKKELGSDKCGHEDDAGVICEEIGTTVTTPATTVTTPATTVTTPATTVTTPATTPSPTTPSTPVRLVNSDNPCSGRVEIFLNGQWQMVCDKGWGMNDARVVCQQLGCGRSVSIPKKAHFGQGSGPISEYQLQCSGQESSITDCKKKELGSDKCGHEDDAGVICEEIGTTVTTPATTVTTPATTVTTPATTVTTPATTPSPTTPSTLVRLVNSDNSCSGRVEIFLNGQWQTVCDKGWGMNDARVVCQQLGCGRSVSIPKKAHFGQGSGPISEYQLQCSGQESSITECKKKELGSDKCGHEDDAGVICEEIGTTVTTPATTVTTPATTVTTPATTVTTPATTPSPTTPSTLVRLVNSDNPCSGRVEIFLNGQWQTVCDKAGV